MGKSLMIESKKRRLRVFYNSQDDRARSAGHACRAVPVRPKSSLANQSTPRPADKDFGCPSQTNVVMAGRHSSNGRPPKLKRAPGLIISPVMSSTSPSPSSIQMKRQAGTMASTGNKSYGRPTSPYAISSSPRRALTRQPSCCAADRADRSCFDRSTSAGLITKPRSCRKGQYL